MERISGGEAIVRSLIDRGVDTVFGLPGVQTYAVFDALRRHGGKIASVFSRHEQGAGYMAFGYARSTGKPGVYCVVPGPGALNSAAALCTAWGCNEPVLCITGEVPSPFIGKRRGYLHELPNQLETMRSLVKWAARIDSAAQAPEIVDEAFRQMTTGRPGPVAIEMAWDVMARRGPVEFPAARPEALKPPLDERQIGRAAQLVAAAKNPLIMTGSGAVEAGREVLALAELLAAPVGAFRSGRGVVSEERELGLNCVEAYELWAETDVLIAIGTRLEAPYIRWGPPGGYLERPAHPKLARIDIDPVEMTRLRADAPVTGDAAEATAALVRELRARHVEGKPPADAARRERIAAAKRAACPKIASLQPQAAYLAAMRRAMPRDGILVEEISQVGYVALCGFPIYAPRTFISSGFQGTLGFGFPTALGVKLANPGKAVVSINGDGGFLYGLAELSAAAQQNIGVVAVVFNNHSYQNVRRDQIRLFQGRATGADLDTPDFAALAETFGVRGSRADTPQQLEQELEQAIRADAPAVIEVEIEKDSEANPWPVINPNL